MNQNIAFIFSFLSLLCFACKHQPVVEKSNFPANIEKIIQSNCTNSGCHNGNIAGELNLTTWQKAFQGSENAGADIVPYSPNWSYLFQHVNHFTDLGLYVEDGAMPPLPYEKLSREDVLTIRQWITEGAKNANGQTYWANREVSTHDKVFILCAGSDLIAVIDISSNKIMHYIPVGIKPDKTETPHYIKLSPDGQYIYISLIEGQSIEKYRTDNYAFVGRVQVTGEPALIEVNNEGSRLLISQWNNDDQLPSISLIDANSMTILEEAYANAPLAHGLTVSNDFRTIYLLPNGANFYARYTLTPDLNHFESEDKFTLDPSEPIPSPSNKYYPYQGVFDEANARLFVCCKNTLEVRVYNTNTNTLITTIPTDSTGRLMVYDADSKRLFVACATAKNTAEQGAIRGCIVVINTETLTLEKKIYNVGHRPHGLKVDKKHNRLYVSSENSGGVDVPHHPTQGTHSPPGKFNVVDLATLSVLFDMETDIAEFPSSVEVAE